MTWKVVVIETLHSGLKTKKEAEQYADAYVRCCPENEDFLLEVRKE